jgi:DNA repair protein RadC
MATINKQNLMVGELQITYKKKVHPDQRITITSYKEAEPVFRAIWDDQMNVRESFYVLFLNRANEVISYQSLSSGGQAGTVVDLKMLFSAALNCLACSIIIAHNHPSDTLKPSDADKRVTDKIDQAAKLLDIQLLDHLIMTQYGCYSFADNGLL